MYVLQSVIARFIFMFLTEPLIQLYLIISRDQCNHIWKFEFKMPFYFICIQNYSKLDSPVSHAVQCKISLSSIKSCGDTMINVPVLYTLMSLLGTCSVYLWLTLLSQKKFAKINYCTDNLSIVVKLK